MRLSENITVYNDERKVVPFANDNCDIKNDKQAMLKVVNGESRFCCPPNKSGMYLCYGFVDWTASYGLGTNGRSIWFRKNKNETGLDSFIGHMQIPGGFYARDPSLSICVPIRLDEGDYIQLMAWTSQVDSALGKHRAYIQNGTEIRILRIGD